MLRDHMTLHGLSSVNKYIAVVKSLNCLTDLGIPIH